MSKIKVMREQSLKGVISLKNIVAYYKTFGDIDILYWRGTAIDISLVNDTIYARDRYNEKVERFDLLGEVEL